MYAFRRQLNHTIRYPSISLKGRLIYARGTKCVCTYGHIYSKSMDQPGKVANPARYLLVILYTNSGGGKERRRLIGPW